MYINHIDKLPTTSASSPAVSISLCNKQKKDSFSNMGGHAVGLLHLLRLTHEILISCRTLTEYL
jgi:hypothetical protein